MSSSRRDFLALVGASTALAFPEVAQAATPVATARQVASFSSHHRLGRVAEVGRHTALFFSSEPASRAAKAVVSKDGGRTFRGPAAFGALDAAVFNGVLYTIRAGGSVQVLRHQGVRQGGARPVWTASVPGFSPSSLQAGRLTATEAGLALSAHNSAAGNLLATSHDGTRWTAKKVSFPGKDLQLSHSSVFLFDPIDRVVQRTSAGVFSPPFTLRYQDNLKAPGSLRSVRVAKDKTLLFRRMGKRFLVFNHGFSGSMPPPKALSLGFQATGADVARHGTSVHIVWGDKAGNLSFIEQPLAEIESFAKVKRVKVAGLDGDLVSVDVSRAVPGRVYLGTSNHRFYVANYLQAKAPRFRVRPRLR